VRKQGRVTEQLEGVPASWPTSLLSSNHANHVVSVGCLMQIFP
jgi:hypothetical protein